MQEKKAKQQHYLSWNANVIHNKPCYYYKNNDVIIKDILKSEHDLTIWRWNTDPRTRTYLPESTRIG